MIPKNLFFLWFGDNPPTYCEFAVNAFKAVNPDFNVEFIRKSADEIDNFENSKDKILQAACKYVIKHRADHLNFFCHVSNRYRVYLIKKYGGIYLDCDTFPVRPFRDGNLLELDTFYKCTTLKDNGLTIFPDLFHMGSPKYDDIYYKCDTKFIYPPHVLYCYDDKSMKNKMWWNLHQKFFNCELKYGETMPDSKGKYIEHFKHLSWKENNRIEKSSKYD